LVRERAADVVELAKTAEVYIDVVIRDFNQSHPDFESDDCGFTEGLVQKKLGADDKPVYKGGKTLTTKKNFDQWWRDEPKVNKRVEMQLHMTMNDKGHLEYDKHDFFPIDGKGFDEQVKGHNYFFTMQMHHFFTYHGGEEFTFRGDDDLWVFINKTLVIDLGGTHQSLSGSVKLDDLGLQKEEVVPLDLFFTERHTVDSNFRVETTIKLDEAVPTTTTTTTPPPTTTVTTTKPPSTTTKKVVTTSTVTTTTTPEVYQCCVFEPLGLMCFDVKQWWTFWCS
jgi:fibro-slime domain-containing protein